MEKNNDLPIGIFDSGVGGLTVLNALMQLLPHENYIYLGDTARLPYGTKSKETVINYSYNASFHLVERGIKLLIVACNTASSYALETLRKRFYPIPVIGVIQPSAELAVKHSGQGPIAVIATEGTVKSRAYTQTILQFNSQCEVVEWPCSLLVALAEEGWHEGPLVENILEQILAPLWQQLDRNGQKTLLLGCTHFPVFKNTIEKILDKNTIVVDSALSVAQTVLNFLEENRMLHQPSQLQSDVCYLVTDGVERFQRVSKFFLKDKNVNIQPELIEIEFNQKQQSA